MGDSFAATRLWNTTISFESAERTVGTPRVKVGGSVRINLADEILSNRGYYQFTNGFTTQTATNDGTGAALAIFCWT
jgi:hypothetical protein